MTSPSVTGLTSDRAPASVPSLLPVPQLSSDGLRSGFAEAARLLDQVADRRHVDTHAQGGDVATWGSDRTAQRHFTNYFVAAALAHQTDLEPDRILDVGSGTGALSRWLAQALDSVLYLHDNDPVVLAAAVDRVQPELASDVLEDLPAADLVTAMEVVEHVPRSDQSGFVGALFDRVRPGGWLVVSTPDESGYPGGSSGYPPHVGCVTGPELEDLLSDATGHPSTVWRLDGGPFASSLLRRTLESVINRCTAALSPWMLTALTKSLHPRERPAPRLADGAFDEVRLRRLDESGDGLVAVVHRPE